MRRVGDASDAGVDVVRAQERYDIGAIDWTSVGVRHTGGHVLRESQLA